LACFGGYKKRAATEEEEEAEAEAALVFLLLHSFRQNSEILEEKTEKGRTRERTRACNNKEYKKNYNSY